jgi:hypothetical protein
VHLAGCADFPLIGADLEEVRRDVPRSDAHVVDGSLPFSDAALDVPVLDFVSLSDISSSSDTNVFQMDVAEAIE